MVLAARALAHQQDVATQAALCGLSHRAFTESFQRFSGLTPKQYGRLRRLQGVLRAAARPQARWVDLALEALFADQSHLNREFRAVFGLTPGQWRLAIGSGPNAGCANHVPLA